jgi:hypothetical protein
MNSTTTKSVKFASSSKNDNRHSMCHSMTTRSKSAGSTTTAKPVTPSSNPYPCSLQDNDALKYVNNAKFRKSIRTQNRTICLKMPFGYYPTGETDLAAMTTDVCSLTLTQCYNLTDVTPLAGLTHLTICSCPNVTDVSPLANVRYLSLKHCNGVTDVSALGGVQYLDLSCCTGIRDITALSDVGILDIFGIPGLSVIINGHRIMRVP